LCVFNRRARGGLRQSGTGRKGRTKKTNDEREERVNTEGGGLGVGRSMGKGKQKGMTRNRSGAVWSEKRRKTCLSKKTKVEMDVGTV